MLIMIALLVENYELSFTFGEYKCKARGIRHFVALVRGANSRWNSL